MNVPAGTSATFLKNNGVMYHAIPVDLAITSDCTTLPASLGGPPAGGCV